VNSHPSTTTDLASRRREQLAVARVRAGDAVALEMIFRAYRVELLTAAQRATGSPDLAEEIVQDVFLSIWNGRDQWHVTSSLRAYLLRSVHNAAHRVRRSRTRGASSGIELETAEHAIPERFAAPDADPSALAERAELGAALDAARAAMPPRARDVFTLRHERDLSARQIADELGLSVKTVESHMSRAFQVLRRVLAPWKEQG
jgi:RNA polymerase sigma-70 factor (ECF subfamily)